MSFFAIPYRVLFHDTMAYGSHHFMTNLKFQCVAREHMFFQELEGAGGEGATLHEEHIFLTQQAYARNMAPVVLGQRVVTLVSIEEQGASSATFCFRVVRQDGAPVSAGFQVIVCLSKATSAMAPIPPFVVEAARATAERLQGPSFRERVLSGRTREIFSAEVIALAQEIAADPGFPGDGRRVSLPGAGEPSREGPDLRTGAVFVFAGQGGYDRETLLALLARPGADAVLERVDQVGRRLLGHSLREALGAGPHEQQAVLARAPDLVQLGIYVTGLLAAAALEEREAPAAMVGHSLGEITALAAAGALSVEDGAAAVCLRCRVLASAGVSGGMMALVGPEPAWRRVLATAGVAPAVVNHDEQVVVSGDLAALEGLERAAVGLVRTIRLQSPYPFHCDALAPAVRPLSAALAGLPLGRPRVPVYSPLEAAWLGDPLPADLGARLAQHLVRPLDFRAALAYLGSRGARRFVVCAPGEAPGSFAKRVIGPEAAVVRLPSPVAAVAPAPATPAPAPAPVATTPGRAPIAIVAAGSVLPGARGLDGLASALAEGRVSLVDASVRDPHATADFCTGGGVRPDKTYTLLGGYVLELPDAPPAFSTEEAAAMSGAERLLAAAVQECLSGLAAAPVPERTTLILGSTADGIREYDEALLYEGLLPVIRGAQTSPEEGDAALASLRETLGVGARAAAALAPTPTVRRVGERLIGPAVRTLLVDAACASSLYALDLGVRELRGGRCDLALCGGFFASGPANACLFSQFRGLSGRGSRPLDLDADGVVFGEGSVVLALRRLSDAVVQGDTVLAVIREIGTSSDGWSSSVALPGRAGQELAMRRALGDQPQLDYLEAHATSTPVGDAVEYSAAAGVLSKVDETIEMGSLKALIGHTGWTAGAASVLKLCLSWRAGLLPHQPSWTAPSTRIPLGHPFRISTSARPWPRRPDGRPRRAGVNGFGFGGSDAMVLLEAADEGLSAQEAPPQPRHIPLAVIGLSARFPAETAQLSQGRGPYRLAEASLRLPGGRPVLPDVLDQMDRAQRLAAAAAAEALAPLGAHLEGLRQEIGVLLGLEGKTEASLRINRRVYADRLRRALPAGEDGQAPIRAALEAELARIPPSGPYTLPGLMPNVAAGRVANLLDLMGPNMVLDAGEDSLFEAIVAAEQLLAEGRGRVALAGGLSAVTAEELQRPDGRPLCEGALVMALTTLSEAEALGVPVLAVLQLDDRPLGEPVARGVDLRGAEGALALAEALRAPETFPALRWGRGALRVQPPGADPRPIYLAVPARTLQPPAGLAAPSWAGERVFALVAGPTPGLEEALVGAATTTVLIPAGRAGPADAIAVSLEQDPSAALAALGLGEADVLVVVLPLGERSGVEAITDRALLDLLFVCARALVGAPRRVGVLRLGLPVQAESSAGPLPPETGLYGGLLRSLARESTDLRCVAVWSTSTRLDEGLAQLREEWAREPRPEIEVIRDGPRREALILREIAPDGPPPALDAGSVVWLTGGARGITATMAEALLKRFGCTVALLGRSRLEDAPDALASKTDAELDQEEPRYYARARAEDPGVAIPELRRRFQTIRSAVQARRTVDASKEWPGRVVYISVDLTDAAATTAAAEALLRALGPPALVVHGAGVQSSGALAKRSLETFRWVVDTKLSGLSVLHEALARAGCSPPFHLLTSAFSFFGNDGQPDYGAANLGMDRLAAALPGWSSLGWLGWAAVGMTQGSEYHALAKVRSMRPVGVPEGAAIFLSRLGAAEGGPTVLLGDGELGWYRPTLVGAYGPRPGPSWTIDGERWTAVARHRVQGVPTLPGAFAVELAARAALLQEPGWQVCELRQVRFLRFLRVPEGRPATLRSVVQRLYDGPDERVLRVWLRAPFVHMSGRVLRPEEDHYSMDLVLRPPAAAPPRLPEAWPDLEGEPSFDAYKHAGDGVSLGEGWPEIRDLLVGPDGIGGALELGDAEATAGFVVPALLIDALSRLCVLDVPGDAGVPVYVPLSSRRIVLAPGITDRLAGATRLTLRAPPPLRAGRGARSAWVEARDAAGASLVRIEGMSGQLAGTVPRRDERVAQDKESV